MLEKWLPLIIYVVVFVAMMVLFTVISKRGKKVEYDERQELIRNRGYKYAFIILAVYIGLYGVFDYVTGIKWCDTYIGCFIGIFISITFIVVFSIFNDSYVPIQTKKRKFYLQVIFMIIIFSSMAIDNLFINKNVFIEGKLTKDSISIFVVTMFLIIFISLIIKDLSDRKQNMAEKI